MNRKTNNHSGFTLVELIVVMCLLGIIMGAILNFIQPTAQLYTTTNTYLSEEEATTTIYDFIKDDLTFANSLTVVASNSNDPSAVASGAGINLARYSNCIVLDNVSVRTQGTEAAVNKGATGSVRKFAYNGSTFVDVTTNPSLLSGQGLFVNSFSIADQSFMEDDKFVFAIGHSGTANSMTLMMDVYNPSYSGGAFTYNNKAFTARKGIEFINIAAGNVVDGPYFYNIQEPDATDMNNPSDYIYIFYNRKSKIISSARQIPFECYVKNSDGVYWMAKDGTVPEGGSMAEDVANYAESQNVNMYLDLPNGYVYERTGLYSETPDEIYADDAVYFDLRNVYTSSSTLKLYAVYKRTRISDMPRLTVNFYSQTGSLIETKSVEFAGTLTDIPSPGSTTTSGGVQTRWMWADMGTTIEHSSFSNIMTDVEVYKCSYYAYKITFLDCEDNVITDSWTDDIGNTYDASDYYVVEGQKINVLPPEANYKLTDEDGNEIGGTYMWTVDSPSGATLGQDVTAPMTVKLQYTPPSATPDPGTPDPSDPDPSDPDPSDPDPSDPDPSDPDPSDPTDPPVGDSSAVTVTKGSESTANWGNYVLIHNIEVKNVSGDVLSGSTITITVKYNCNVSINQQPSWIGNYISGMKFTASGDTLTIEFKTNTPSNQWDARFGNGDSFNFSMTMNVPDGNAKVESITAVVS